MQSGITGTAPFETLSQASKCKTNQPTPLPASADLHKAFADFTANPALFALPVTISSESLTPLPAVPFSMDFASSLPLVEPHVHPKTPIYLLLRKTNGGNEI